MDIQIYDHTNEESKANIELVQNVLNFAGDYLKLAENTEMSVTLMHNDEIHGINKTYRKVDRATDVISFAIEDDEDSDPIIMDDELAEEIAPNIGDLMISVDKVKEQAEYLGHSYQRELGFLCVHGFLHLNGYDHMETKDQEVMFPLQKEILNAYGLKR
ncbi:Metal-dependent hydrolase YbeY, involved in rRNA and/or ribosome maturation and assembly [Pediococcus damnosus]|uniref:Endoribonuclease YbeY n=1 Tax=Pediococcus damnosus TaxID=51663 RepID=A0A0R2HMB5_9LACO|nr:rRNA maturation RNase YbeY [Pediococcus damnosus]AMV61584.1 Metal-dependent hydrolase YbeY, involved in rRNA and/or ribosome maturation and assembly [Pediococcus damnosus]AMV62053.1 Metal-dependent hydrolase YbeY, involved in rRNA and/or ribosome maturation and assembly [Pediococcus damnosus]AMV65945.1 Metal-dependent hydrolase YbeY, involved in rRNA and/or ribosome maturation and assembly [Pediococcus damnosus]AMV68097.1 Metal-dependent hydrolase YbeY, involved in rRNA and/or ribosome matur